MDKLKVKTINIDKVTNSLDSKIIDTINVFDKPFQSILSIPYPYDEGAFSDKEEMRDYIQGCYLPWDLDQVNETRKICRSISFNDFYPLVDNPDLYKRSNSFLFEYCSSYEKITDNYDEYIPNARFFILPEFVSGFCHLVASAYDDNYDTHDDYTIRHSYNILNSIVTISKLSLSKIKDSKKPECIFASVLAENCLSIEQLDEFDYMLSVIHDFILEANKNKTSIEFEDVKDEDTRRAYQLISVYASDIILGCNILTFHDSMKDYEENLLINMLSYNDCSDSFGNAIDFDQWMELYHYITSFIKLSEMKDYKDFTCRYETGIFDEEQEAKKFKDENGDEITTITCSEMEDDLMKELLKETKQINSNSELSKKDKQNKREDKKSDHNSKSCDAERSIIEELYDIINDIVDESNFEVKPKEVKIKDMSEEEYNQIIDELLDIIEGKGGNSNTSTDPIDDPIDWKSFNENPKAYLGEINAKYNKDKVKDEQDQTLTQDVIKDFKIGLYEAFFDYLADVLTAIEEEEEAKKKEDKEKKNKCCSGASTYKCSKGSCKCEKQKQEKQQSKVETEKHEDDSLIDLLYDLFYGDIEESEEGED